MEEGAAGATTRGTEAGRVGEVESDTSMGGATDADGVDVSTGDASTDDVTSVCVLFATVCQYVNIVRRC